MASEVDRLLLWMRRVECLEADLQETHPAIHGLIRAKLESAKRAQHTAFSGLISAAHSGDPEAIVALDALASEKQSRMGPNAPSRVSHSHLPAQLRRRLPPISTKWAALRSRILPFN